MINNQLVFIHLPRTAGTSLGTALANAYREQGLKVCPYTNWEHFVAATDLDNYDLIGGHSYYPLVRMLNRNPVFITMLGEPINRTVSSYYMLKGLYHGPRQSELIDLSLAGLLSDTYWFGILNNLQTRMLGADFNIGSIRNTLDFETKIQANKLTLEKAKVRLSSFPFVGIKEYFDESLKNLSQLLGLKLIKTNDEKPRYSAKDLDDFTLSKLEQANEYDIELFAWGLGLFRRE